MKGLRGQLTCSNFGIIGITKVESILETLIDNKDLGRVALGDVTYYGLKSPAARGKRLVLKNNDFDVVQ